MVRLLGREKNHNIRTRCSVDLGRSFFLPFIVPSFPLSLRVSLRPLLMCITPRAPHVRIVVAMCRSAREVGVRRSAQVDSGKPRRGVGATTTSPSVSRTLDLRPVALPSVT